MMSRVPAPQAPTGDSWAPSRLFGPRPPSSPKSLRPCLSPAMDDRREADSQHCQRSVGTAHRRPRELPSGRHDLRLSGDTFLPRPVVLARRDGFPLRTSVPEPPEGRHEITQPHVSDGPLEPHSRGTDPVTGCRPRNRGSGGGAAGSEDGPLKPCGWTTVSLSALCVPRRRRTASSSVRGLTRPSQRFSDSCAHDRHSLHTKAWASAATLIFVPEARSGSEARSGPTAAAPRLQQACRGEVIQTQRGAQQLNC